MSGYQNKRSARYELADRANWAIRPATYHSHGTELKTVVPAIVKEHLDQCEAFQPPPAPIADVVPDAGGSIGPLARYSRDTRRKMIGAMRRQVGAAVAAGMADARRGRAVAYRRRQAEALVARALRNGVKLDAGAAVELLDQRGAMKFARRANGSKQAAEKAFAYCESQRDLSKRHVAFRDAYAFYLGYRAEAP